MSDNIYSIIYYIDNVSNLRNYIRTLNIQKIGNSYESKVYLVKINYRIKTLLLSEPNFIRLGLDNNGVYAIFKIPKKYEYLVVIVDKTGYRGMTKEMLFLYNEKALSKKYSRLFLFQMITSILIGSLYSQNTIHII